MNTAEMRRLAEAATKGPWTNVGYGTVRRLEPAGPLTVAVTADRGWMTPRSEPDAAYIAACDPSTILRLLDVVEAAKAWADPFGPDDMECRLAFSTALDALEDES